MPISKKPEFPILLRILLPFLAALVLAMGPRANAIEERLAGSTVAQGIDQSASAAVLQQDLTVWESWRTELWQSTGQFAVSGGDLDRAVANLEQARELGKLTTPGQRLLGEVYWNRQEKELALTEWKPLMQQGLVSPDVYRRVVQYRRGLGNLVEAAWYAQLWHKNFPSDWTASWQAGLLMLPVDWTKAGEGLQQAVKLEPTQLASAQALLQVISQNETSMPEEYRLVQIGRALGGLGEWDLALAVFEKSKQANPEFADAWAFSSEALQQLNRDGRADLAQALLLAPDSAAIQALAGLNYRRGGDLGEALNRFFSAATLEPQRAIWLMEIGNSYADLHDLQKGLEYYQKAVDLDPLDSSGWRSMAQFCLTHEFALRESGLPAARQAVTLAGEDPANLDMLGQMLLALGDEISGERFLQQAIPKSDVFPDADFHLGQLYLRQGKMEWAEYHLARAARLSSKNPEIGAIAQRLLVRYFGGR